MKLYFSVNSPKLDKRKIDRGEDAPPVNQEGIMVICDGTGATGQAEHTIMDQVYTSAYLGSRRTSKLATDYLSANYQRFIDSFSDIDRLQALVTQLGETLRNDLAAYVRKNQLTLTVHGKSFKLLPTTFTGVVYQVREEGICAIVLSAGDSRALWWDDTGLHQLSVEDSDSKTLSSGDCSASNCISADGDFQISFRCYTLPPKGILLATSDGFTDPIKPFEQERYLIEWLGNFEALCQETAPQLSAEISDRLDQIGFTRRDDCTIAGAILGYSSGEALKDAFRRRYKSELIDTYLKPYKQLSAQYKQAEAELTEAESALHKAEPQIVAVVTDGITQYLNSCHASQLQTDGRFQSLLQAEAISAELARQCNLIDNDLQKKKRQLAEAEVRLKADYLEFLKLLCRDFGEVRFSEELVCAVRAYYDTKALWQDDRKKISSQLSDLNQPPEALTGVFLANLSAALEKLTAQVGQAKRNCAEYEKNAQIVTRYFSYQNEDILRFYDEDMQNNFFILKKIGKFPLFASKKYNSLQSLCQSMVQLRETLQSLQKQTADAAIQNKKTSVYKDIVLRFCRQIARELFYKDRFWEHIPQELSALDIPPLSCYKQRKDDLQALIAQRQSLEALYIRQYEAYLLNPSAQGKLIFEKEGCSQYGND